MRNLWHSLTYVARQKQSQQKLISTITSEGVINCDRLRLSIQAGNGGHGLERYNGIGGKGGDVIMVGNPKMTFEEMVNKYRGGVMKVKGQNGDCATNVQLVGANGRPKILKVPLGVDVVDARNKLLIARCARPFFNYVLARGGQGGCAENCFRATAGERYIADFHLKLHPNIGLVGFPNAGKSTLMKALIPKKNIKIANYPFTTTKPQLAYIENFESESGEDEDESFSLSIADLPGLIEGAALNRGRGREFLKHLEYSDILLMVVDVLGFKFDLSLSNPYRNALETIALLNIEMEKYDPGLVTKPTIIALNKIDLSDGKQKAEELVRILKKKDWSKAVAEDIRPLRPLHIETVIPIIAKDRQLGDLKSQLKNIYERRHPLSAGVVGSRTGTVLA